MATALDVATYFVRVYENSDRNYNVSFSGYILIIFFLCFLYILFLMNVRWMMDLFAVLSTIISH